MNIAAHIIGSSDTIRQGLAQLNNLSGGSMTLFVIDKDGAMVGTLTDGDIRRALLAGINIEDPVIKAANKDFKYLEEGSIDVEKIRNCRISGINLLPLLGKTHNIVSAINLSVQHNKLPLRAILMAGGKGERLRPATLHTPKPLLEIEGKAIIDYNIEALAACGINDITVATGYLAEQLIEHFKYSAVDGITVKTVKENLPLGTIGAASLLSYGSQYGDTLVMNSDLLTTISFEEMYMTHKSNHADITIAVVPYQVSVPYAVVEVDTNYNNRVTAIEEKPSYSYYANAGIYIFSDRILATLPTHTHCDATDLISKSISEGAIVTHYTIKGTWIDVGSPVDFHQACELMHHHKSLQQTNR